MPRIPYNPLPDIQPEVAPRVSSPRYEVKTSPELFGSNVGQAAEHFGVQLGDVGNELFSTAMKIQDLKLDNEARDAVTNLQNQIVPLRASYMASEQKDAVDGQQPFLAQSQKIYTNILNGLSSPIAKQKFQQDAAFWMRSNSADAASHSATELKKYTIGTNNAAIATNFAGITANPTDDKTFQHVMDTNDDLIRKNGAQQGYSPEEVQHDIDAHHSTGWLMRITEIARKDPRGALKMYQDAKDKGEIQGKDLMEADATVQRSLDSHGAVQLSDRVYSPQYWMNQKHVDLGRVRIAFGGEESGNRYGLTGPQTAHGVPLGRFQVMSDFLADYLKAAGMPSMTTQQFLKDPTAQNELFDRTIGKYLDDGYTVGEAANKWFTGSFHPSEAKHDVLGTHPAAYRAAIGGILAQIGKGMGDKASLRERVDAARAEAEKEDPGNDRLADNAANQVETRYNREARVKQSDNNDAWESADKATMNYYDKTGHLPTTLDELRQVDPGVDTWLNKMDDKNKLKLQNSLATFSRKDRVMTTEQYANYLKLRGMLMSGDPAQVEQALNTPALAQPWPMNFIDRFQNEQFRAKSKTTNFPEVNRAMSLIEPSLADNSVNIQRGSDDYFMVKALMADEMEEYQRRNAKPMPPDEVKALGWRLVAQVKGGFFGFGRELFVQQQPPDDATAGISAALEKRGVTPTPQLIQRLFLQQLLENQGKKSTETVEEKANAASGGPSVPESK